MFNFLKRIQRWWSNLISPKTIEQKLKIETAISDKMETMHKCWFDMYTNVETADPDGNKIHSLNLPYIIASEKSRIATLELKTKVYDPSVSENDEIPDGEERPNSRAEFLNAEYQRFIKRIRHKITPGLALGTMAIKAVPDLELQTFSFDFILANEFFPVAFNAKGILTHAVFIEQITKQDYTYTKLETHKLNDGVITVTNEAYKSSGMNASTELGYQISLEDVSEWANLQPTTQIASTNGVKLDRLLVTMFTMPESNSIDVHSKLGMSCFEPARELIDNANRLYSDFLWEFEGGALAIDADADALREIKDREGNVITNLPKNSSRLFRTVNISNVDGKDLYSPYNPQLRDSSYINGLNAILTKIEDSVSMARGTFSEAAAEARTATEIKTLRWRTYQSNKDIQETLQVCFEDLVYTMDVYATLYGFAPNGEYKTKFHWDDSILIDMAEEMSQRNSLVSLGILKPEENAAWYLGVSLEKRFKDLAAYDELKQKYMPEPEEIL